MKKYSKPIDLNDLGRSTIWRKEIANDQKLLAGKFFSTTDRLNYCPICKCKESNHYVEVYEFVYNECINCGHIFCSTRPSIEKSENLYKADSDEKSVQAKVYLDEKLYLKRTKSIAEPKVDYIIENLPKIKSLNDLKWVDVGSGAGEILSACKKRGINAVGVESDPNEAIFATQRGLNVINKMINENNSLEIIGDADIVSAFNVLEHVHDPINFLRNLSSGIDDCIIVFEVPRHPSISSFLNQCFPDQACRHIYPPDHLHIFTESSIKFMLDSCDLQLKSVWYFGQDFYEMVNSCASEANYESKFLLEILKLSNKMQEIIDQSELGDTALIIAEKKHV